MQLFFSYGHDHNVPLVDYLRRDLEREGYTVWVDRHDIKSGDDWRRSIVEGILGSEAAFSFASAYSVRVPGVCLNELSIAVGAKGAWVQSVLLEEGVTPHRNVRFRQAFDMSGWLDHVSSAEFLEWYGRWRNRLASADSRSRGRVFREYYGSGAHRLLASDETFLAWYEPIAQQIKERLSDPLVEQYADELRELREIMAPDELNHKQRSLEEEAYSGRAWLKGSMDDWSRDAYSPRTLLITGGPGVGKSSFVAHELLFDEHVGAAVYCEWNNPASNSPDRVARAIAYQLACRFPDYRALLINILRRERAQASVGTGSPAGTAFERYVVEPLTTGINSSTTFVILVDGIDEVETAARERGLPELISEYAQMLPEWIRFVVTCRSNSGALRYLREARRLVIDEQAEENLGDVREYVALRLGAGQEDPLVDRVLQASGGVFLHAALLCDELQHGWIGEDEVSEVPQSLGQVYHRYYQRMFADAEDRGYGGQATIGCKEALSVLALGLEPVPLRTLGCAADWDEPQTTSFLSRCAHFLTVADERVSFTHKSIPDWLRSPDAGEYQTSDAVAWKALAVACYTQYDNGVGQMDDFELRYLLRCLCEAKASSRAFSPERTQFSEALDQALTDDNLGRRLLACGNESLEGWRYDLAEHYARDAIEVFGNLAAKGEGSGATDAVQRLGDAYLLLASALDLSVRLEDAVRCCDEGLAVLEGCLKAAGGSEKPIHRAMGQLQSKKAYVLYRIGHDEAETEREFESAYRCLVEADDAYGAADTLVLLGKAHRLGGKHGKAVNCAERIEETLDLDACEEENPEFYCYVRVNQGDFYINAHEYAKAKDCLDDALRVSAGPSVQLPLAWAAQMNLQLSQLCYRTADYKEGVRHAEKALELECQAYGNVSVEACNGLNQLGNCLLRQGLPVEALANFMQSYDIRRRLYGEVNRFTAISLRNCARARMEMSGEHLARAEEEFQRVLAIHEELHARGGALAHVAETRLDLSNVCLRSGRFEDALDYARKAGEGYQTALTSVEEDKLSFASCWQSEGEALLGLGRTDEGKVRLEDALRLCEEAYAANPDHPRIVRLREMLAKV